MPGPPRQSRINFGGRRRRARTRGRTLRTCALDGSKPGERADSDARSANLLRPRRRGCTLYTVAVRDVLGVSASPLVLTILLAACRFDASFDGTSYQCGAGDTCPS